jgi:hypothetical protein
VGSPPGAIGAAIVCAFRRSWPCGAAELGRGECRVATSAPMRRILTQSSTRRDRQFARSSGIAFSENIASPEVLAAKMRSSTARNGAECLVLATEPDIDVVQPPVALDPVLTKHRFMAAIGAPRYVPTLFGGGKLEPT